MQKRSTHKRTAGFTLVELMIVVAIIGVLAAIAIPQYTLFTTKSKRSEVYVMLQGVHTAQTSYLANADHYLSNGNALLVNQDLGVFDSTTTKFGYQFYYDFIPPVPNPLATSYFVALSNDFDGDGFYDAVILQSQGYNFVAVGAYPSGAPYLLQDDITNTSN